MLRLRRLTRWISVVTAVTAIALIGTVAPAAADIPNTEIVNNVDGLCVMEQGIPEAPVIQSSCTDYPREIWNFTTVGTSLYTINNATGDCLTGEPAFGDPAYSDRCFGATSQEWYIVGKTLNISLRNADWNVCLVRADAVTGSQLVVSVCPSSGGQWYNPNDY